MCIRKSILTILALLATGCTCLAATPLERATKALQRALGSRAEWTMSRQLAASTRTLVSSGTVDCVVNSGIVWRVLAPFPSTVAMTRTEMVFTDEEGTRRKKLSELPHYTEIRDRTDQFAAGKTDAFEGLFKLSVTEGSFGTWRLELIPEIAALKQLFTKVEVSGDELPTLVQLHFAKGGTSRIHFKDVKRAR